MTLRAGVLGQASYHLGRDPNWKARQHEAENLAGWPPGHLQFRPVKKGWP